MTRDDITDRFGRKGVPKKKKKILFSVLLEKHSTKIIVSLISFHQTNCLSIKETAKTVE